MKKKCRFCGSEFETLPNGGSRQFCFNCVPEGLSASERTVKKRQSAKKQGVKNLGGKCLKCGETRPYILSFHHLDAKEKDNVPSRYIANSQFDLFFKEIQKCGLLCNNCHGEFHYLEANKGITIENYLQMSKEEIYNIYSDPVEEHKYTYAEQPKCKKCGKIISLGTKTQLCSKCQSESRRIVKRPDKEKLFEILMINKGNFTKVGSLFNVTDNAIRKWCKSYNLPFHSSDYKV